MSRVFKLFFLQNFEVHDELAKNPKTFLTINFVIVH